MKCSLGIFAYNEEKNIGQLLNAILNQKLKEVDLEEIIVVASGCTDKTVPIVKEIAKKDLRIKVLIEKERKGKAASIHHFIQEANNDILVIESGDTLPSKNTIENLVKPFKDKKVGMTGVRPVPVNDQNTLMGAVVHLLWRLHHEISLKDPKMGEMVAFRKIFKQMPLTAVDEAYIEGLLKSKGYKIVYVPEAIVYNKGAETMIDFLQQRRRIHCGHRQLKKETSHQVSTSNPLKIFLLILKKSKFSFRFVFTTSFAIFLEALARFLGWWDFKIKKKSHVVWQTAKTTKKLEK